ncbi:MAG: hypothetical protein AB7Q97_23435 [Gammaproteobacteria bacterium]
MDATTTATAPAPRKLGKKAEAAVVPGAGVSLPKYAFLLAQLGLLALALRQFQIESNALLNVSLLGFAGFAVHYFLPLPLRMPFFVLLSMAGIGLVFGLVDAAWMVGFGLVLIGLCHLPVKFGTKVAALLAAGAGFAALRMEVVTGPWSSAIWPILGAMFMFRTAVYVYDLQHEKVPPSPWRTLAYFFPLPNVCFPMFPVLDYKGFRRGYYDIERHRIYQIGVDWMARGVLHLILYRACYYYFTVPPAEVNDPDSLARFLVANFMLYLKISGTFHFITGMMHLFGFNLVETHHRYCLSSSFTDFWRRINIYWKDFMMKLFYYPLYFRLKQYGATTALVVSTLAVFVCTWILHSYQWFWLRGDFPIEWQDGAFWMILAVLVIVGSLRELKHGRTRKLSKGGTSIHEAISRGLFTVGIFFLIATLWSLWGCESLAAWVSLFDFLWRGIPEGGSAFPGLFLAIAAVVFVGGVWLGQDNKGEGTAAGHAGKPLAPSTLVTVATLVLIAGIGVPAVYTALGTNAANVVLSLRSGQLSRADAAMQEKGYYEDLTRVNRFNSELWKLYMKEPPINWLDVQSGGAGLTRLTGDFQKTELTPSFKADTPFGPIQTNSLGMRDREFAPEPAAGEHRIAVVGPSTVMGWGVRIEDTFGRELERRLNAAGAGTGFTVMNFGIPDYYPAQELKVLDKAAGLKPETVLYVATGRELTRNADFLAGAATRGIAIPYPALADMVARAEVAEGVERTTALKRLLPVRRELLDWVYRDFVRRAREAGMTPVWVFVPQIMPGAGDNEYAAASATAAAAGFTVVNLDGVFDAAPAQTLSLTESDRHPNAEGHRLIGEALHRALTGPGGVLSGFRGE